MSDTITRLKTTRGMAAGSRGASRGTVRALLSAPQDEALGWIDHHKDNAQFLEHALSLEQDRPQPRPRVIARIRKLQQGGAL